MTNKQKRFYEEYLIDLNATQAAIRAGYSPDSARQSGSDNMNNPYIRARIDKAIAEQSKRTGVNADRVIRELAKIGFVNPDDVFDTKTATIKESATKDDIESNINMLLEQTHSFQSKFNYDLLNDIESCLIALHEKVVELQLSIRRAGTFVAGQEIYIPIGVV